LESSRRDGKVERGTQRTQGDSKGAEAFLERLKTVVVVVVAFVNGLDWV